MIVPLSNVCVWVGWEPREKIAFDVAVNSLRVQSGFDPAAYALDLVNLRRMGHYQRPTEERDGRLWDVISDAPMSTEFAISRFFVPELTRNQYDWALFVDCDVMFRAPLEELLALVDKTKAVQVVKHPFLPSAGTKMDGQVQTAYPRKNWSSVMLWNLNHPANRTLTLMKLNTWTGRALHGLQWLADEFIGELPPEWNHLVGVNGPDPEAKLVHFTLGIPTMEGYSTCEHAAEWWGYARTKDHRFGNA